MKEDHNEYSIVDESFFLCWGSKWSKISKSHKKWENSDLYDLENPRALIKYSNNM